MNIEELKNLAANLDLSNFKGDVVLYKHVDHQFGNIESGGIGIQIIHGKEDEDNSIYPRRGDYAGVLAWLERQKKKEHIDYYLASGQNRSKMCRKLSEIFGWEVSENSLRKAEENQKK